MNPDLEDEIKDLIDEYRQKAESLHGVASLIYDDIADDLEAALRTIDEQIAHEKREGLR